MPLDGGHVEESKALAKKANNERGICSSSDKNLVGSQVVYKNPRCPSSQIKIFQSSTNLCFLKAVALSKQSCGFHVLPKLPFSVTKCKSLTNMDDCVLDYY